MNETNGFLMTPGCPWVDLRAWSGLPNVRWCEEQLCAWISTPANTWTNLGYIFVGFYFFWATRNDKSDNIRFFGTAALWVGWTSFVYHASLTFATQVLDFLGMFIFFYSILMHNFARIGWLKPESLRKATWILTIITTAISSTVDYFGFPIQGMIFFLILIITATEFIAKKKATKPYVLRNMVLAYSFLLVGVAFSASDVTRKFCDPTNHWLQGHALWHLSGAIGMFFLVRFFRQFYSEETGKLEV